MVKPLSLLAQRDFLLKGESVVVLTGNEFSKKEGMTLTQQVSGYDYYLKQKTRLHHRHILFERGSSRDCDAKVRINN